MPAPTLVYPHGAKAAYDAALALGTPKLMLLDDSHVIDQGNHDFIDDVSADEAAGTGYTAGGVTLTGVATSVDATAKTFKLDADDTSGYSVACCYEVVYVDTGTPSTSPILSITDLSDGAATNVTSTGTLWSSTGGIFTAAF